VVVGAACFGILFPFEWMEPKCIRMKHLVRWLEMGLYDLGESLPPISAAANRVTNTAENQQDNPDNQEQPPEVIQEGKLNKPTN
jgi:hypothetical protein